MNPLLNTPRIITVKLYHVQCSNESLLSRVLSRLGQMLLQYKMSRLNVQKILYKNVQLICGF